MNKLIYLIAAMLSMAFFSCSSDDEQDDKGSPGTEEPKEDGLKTTEVKEMLCGTDIWKMEYQGYTFYFQFKEDGTVTSTPGDEQFYLKEDVISKYNLDYNGNAEVLLTIVGSGALKYLDSGIENTIVITEYSSEKITATGWNNKEAKMNLIPAVESEFKALQDIRKEKMAKLKVINAIKAKKDLMVGVLCDADGLFIAHYKLTGNKLENIIFTYFDGDKLLHESLALSINEKSVSEYTLTFEPVTVKERITSGHANQDGKLRETTIPGKTITEFFLNYNDLKMSVSGGLVLKENLWDAVDFYLNSYGPMHKIQFNNPYGSASPRLLEELKTAKVGEIDLDDRPGRNIIFLNSGGPFQFVGYKGNLTKDESEPGLIHLKREKFYYPVDPNNNTGESGGQYVDENCSQFLSAYFDEDGHYFIREAKTRSLYMLSPTKDAWFRWEHDGDFPS